MALIGRPCFSVCLFLCLPACSGELRIAPLRDKTRDSGKGKKDTKGRISGGGGGGGGVGGRGGGGREGGDGREFGGEGGGAKEKRRLSLCPGCYLLKKKTRLSPCPPGCYLQKKKEREIK